MRPISLPANWQIPAERQEFVQIAERSYALDFAIYCAGGKIDVETDGDTYHTGPERVPEDNVRHNDLATAGWTTLRFNTPQIREQIETYCLPHIVDTINKLDGAEKKQLAGRRFELDVPGGLQQLLLDDL